MPAIGSSPDDPSRKLQTAVLQPEGSGYDVPQMIRPILLPLLVALLAGCQTSAGAEGGEAESGAQLVAEAAKRPGAVTLPSGIVFVPEREGSGASPSANDVVSVAYRGTLADGTEFDSTGGATAEFPLTSVIRCWTEAMQLMKVGGKATIICPPATAYGYRGAPPRVPRSATLKFEVELRGVR